MIVKDKDKVSWVRLLFHFRGSSFMVTWPRILTVTVTSMIVTYVELYYSIQSYTFTTTPFLLLGVTMGIFLAFPNNASYDKLDRTKYGKKYPDITDGIFYDIRTTYF